MKNVTLLILALALATSACRIANNEKKLIATPQPRGELRLPGTAGEGALLVEDELAPQFGGSLLIWADGVSKEQIAAISRASVDGRLAKSVDMDYRWSTLKITEKKLEAIGDEITVVDQAMQQAKLDNRDSDFARDLQKGLAAGWFERRVGELKSAAILDEATSTGALDSFQAYCEFKLYELSVSRLIQLDYAKRPTPLSMCEAYYASRTMFKGASCADGQGNYFDCIWSEGVFKSQTFAALEAHSPEGIDCAKSGAKRAAAFRDWLASGVLKRVVFDNEPKPVDLKTYAQLFEAALLNGKTLNMTKIGVKKLNGQLVYPEIAKCKPAVQRSDLSAQALDGNAAGWQQAELGSLKAIGESSEGQIQVFTIFSIDQTEPEATRLPKEGVLKNLRLYAERNTGAVGEQRDVLVSVDDSFFNRPTGPQVEAYPANVANVKDDAAFAELFAIDELLIPQELKDQKATLLVQQAEIDAQRKSESDQADLLFERISNANVDGIHALTAPGALALSRKLVIEIEDDGEVLNATFQVGSGVKYRGCLKLAAGVQIACANAAAGEALAEAVAYDAATGKFSLSGVILEAAASGFAPKALAAGDPDFSTLPLEAFALRTLTLDFYAARLGERFQFISGNAKLANAAGKVELEGSFSADSYKQ